MNKVTQNSHGTYILDRKDGSLICWGIVELFIPEGGAHARQGYLYLPKFAETPSVTTTIYSDESSGQMFSVWNLTFDDGDPSTTLCKVSAANVEIGVPSQLKYLCHFHAIGKPGQARPGNNG